MTHCCRLLKAILLICLLPSTYATSQEAVIESSKETQKLAEYSALLHAVIYDWNFTSAISNEDIKIRIEESGIQQDESELSVVFRHLMALSTAEEEQYEKVPVFVKMPLLEKNWGALKELSIETYAYARAYGIYIEGLNNYKGTKNRSQVTIPALQQLKREMLKTGNKHAVATVSMWLAMEYSESSPLREINEIEYALPHLPVKSSSDLLKTELDKPTALAWLADSYNELNIPSRALEYGEALIALKKKHELVTVLDYSYAISAANTMDKHDIALNLIEDAKTINTEQSPLQKLILHTLELTTHSYVSNFEPSNIIKDLALAIEATDIKEVPILIAEIKEYASLVHDAFFGSDDEFEKALIAYNKVVSEKIEALPFKRQAELEYLLTLKHVFTIRKDYGEADHYRQKFNATLIKYNTQLFEFDDNLTSSSLAEDVELEMLRQKEIEQLRQERLGLYNKTENMRSTINALLIVILTLLSSWLWFSRNRAK